MKYSLLSRLFAIPLLAVLLSLPACADDTTGLRIKSGEKIAFLGDSITAQGAATAAGYVRLVISGLASNGIEVTAIPAGVSGHRSNDMLKRLDHDVLSKKPDWMTLSCGVNDVWHGGGGVALESFESNITAIVDQAQAAGIKVMILTATMISEDQAAQNNQKLIAYNDFLRDLAKEKKCLLADLNADMQAAVTAGKKTAPPGELILTVDGIHMTGLGNQMMAAGILRAFGLTSAQVEKLQKGWSDMPGTMQLAAKIGLSTREYNRLVVIAAEKKQTVTGLLDAEVKGFVESLLKESPAQP